MTKYVILNEIFVTILSDTMTHSDVGNLTVGGPMKIKGKATSAAFFDLVIVEGKVRVKIFGESKSLNLGPDPKDAEIIERLLCLAK